MQAENGTDTGRWRAGPAELLLCVDPLAAAVDITAHVRRALCPDQVTPLGVPREEQQVLQARATAQAAGRVWASEVEADLAAAEASLDRPYSWRPRAYSPSAGAFVRELMGRRA